MQCQMTSELVKEECRRTGTKQPILGEYGSILVDGASLKDSWSVRLLRSHGLVLDDHQRKLVSGCCRDRNKQSKAL